MNIKIGILNVPKHENKYDLIHFVTNGLERDTNQLSDLWAQKGIRSAWASAKTDHSSVCAL